MSNARTSLDGRVMCIDVDGVSDAGISYPKAPHVRTPPKPFCADAGDAPILSPNGFGSNHSDRQSSRKTSRHKLQLESSDTPPTRAPSREHVDFAGLTHKVDALCENLVADFRASFRTALLEFASEHVNGHVSRTSTHGNAWRTPNAMALESIETQEAVRDEVAELFEMIDKNGDGELQKAEFVRAFKQDDEVRTYCMQHTRLAAFLNPLTFKEVFDTMDLDASNTISEDELREYVLRKNSFSQDGGNALRLAADATLPESSASPRDASKERSLFNSNGKGGRLFDNSKLDEEVYDVEKFYWDFGYAQAIARSESFVRLTLAVICLNALYLGIDADWNTATMLLDAEWPFILCEYVFCIYFLFEWIVRFAAFRRKMDSLRDGWFKFDTLLVLLMVMETCVIPFVMPILSSANESNPPPTGPLRLMRLLRLSRLVRLMRSLPELVIICKGMLVAFRAVSSSLLMVTLLIYVFAIVLHMLLKDDPEASEYFATLPVCMWTLLMDGTFLLDTGDVLGLIVHRGEPHCIASIVVFLVFILLTPLTVLNMLIGVLCEVVSAVSVNEKEEAAIHVMKQTILLELKKFDDGDGMIDESELGEMMSDPASVSVLQSLGIDVAFLQELQVMTYSAPGSVYPIDMLIEQMLSCRSELNYTVKHMVMQQRLTQWTLQNSLMRQEERMRRLIQKRVANQQVAANQKKLAAPDPSDCPEMPFHSPKH
eukprot:TRINITY_DN5599_c0_g2_i1.p1 TRINITY_DN5599_c0_g2~~TRINITY_DN5599_c0_g2_i1.p1  ORF type:complete len:714 (+),score=93.34 TRINITY_DN5599_c0_g2_i1:72-2213(+)